MAKVENVDVPGVFQLENGLWGYRFTITVNGNVYDVTVEENTNGAPAARRQGQRPGQE